MPELPEVETVRRGLAPVMEGAVIEKATIRRPDLRRPFPARFANRLKGRGITSLGRRAKYLLADLDDGMALVMHLGMSGSFRIETEGTATGTAQTYHPKSKLAKHDHVVFDLSSGARVVYNDPRRFGVMDLIARSELEQSPIFANLGIEPLGNRLDGEAIRDLFRDRVSPLKAALLDQRLIAGLGNIYVCEALWRSGLSPTREAGTLGRKSAKAKAGAGLLAASIRAVLEEAIAAGGSSLKDHRQANGELGYFQHRFAVYDREGEACPKDRCNGTINRLVQSGRSTFYCSVCQT